MSFVENCSLCLSVCFDVEDEDQLPRPVRCIDEFSRQNRITTLIWREKVVFVT
jgi:hypothetical protein